MYSTCIYIYIYIWTWTSILRTPTSHGCLAMAAALGRFSGFSLRSSLSLGCNGRFPFGHGGTASYGHLHDLGNLLLGREWHPKVLVQDYWPIVAKQQSEHHFIGKQTFWMLKAAVHLKSCHVGKIVYPYTQWFCWSLSLLNGYNWGYTPFSDIPMFAFRFLKISQHFTSQWPK